MIKDLINRLRHLHYLDPLMNEAADALERLTSGDVELPEPDTHCFDEDTGSDVWSYSAAQLRDYGDRRAAAVLQETNHFPDAGNMVVEEALQRLSDIHQEMEAGQKPVAAQHRFRHPQKGTPDWSVWQPCKVSQRPGWEVDSQVYEVEYRALYTHPAPETKEQV